MASKTEAKTIPHAFTTGAALVLKHALSQPGWYKDKPIATILAAAQIPQRAPLVDLKDPPTRDQETQEAYDARVAATLDRPCPMDLTEDERVACRTCMEVGLKHGIHRLTPHIVNLITELEIK